MENRGKHDGEFSFLYLNLKAALRIQLLDGLATLNRLKVVEIIAK